MTPAAIDTHARNIARDLAECIVDEGRNSLPGNVDHATRRILTLVHRAVREARDEDQERALREAGR